MRHFIGGGQRATNDRLSTVSKLETSGSLPVREVHHVIIIINVNDQLAVAATLSSELWLLSGSPVLSWCWNSRSYFSLVQTFLLYDVRYSNAMQSINLYCKIQLSEHDWDNIIVPVAIR